MPEGQGGMKFRRRTWLSDFMLMFSLFVAANALRKLHSVGQLLIGLVSEAVFAARQLSAHSTTFATRETTDFRRARSRSGQIQAI